jgi:uncharacterized membrane protein
MGENHFARTPTAVNGAVLLLAALSYYVLQAAVIREHGPDSVIAHAIGRDVKGKLSPAIYAAGIGLTFVSRWLGLACYVIVALIWLVPDRRLESHLSRSPGAPSFDT